MHMLVSDTIRITSNTCRKIKCFVSSKIMLKINIFINRLTAIFHLPGRSACQKSVDQTDLNPCTIDSRLNQLSARLVSLSSWSHWARANRHILRTRQNPGPGSNRTVSNLIFGQTVQTQSNISASLKRLKIGRD